MASCVPWSTSRAVNVLGCAFGVPHIAAPRTEQALAVGVVFNSGNCSPSEDEAAEESAASSGEEAEFSHVTSLSP